MGASDKSLAQYFMIGRPTVTKMIPSVLKILIENLKHCGKIPKTEREWTKISNRFDEKWDLDHTIGKKY